MRNAISLTLLLTTRIVSSAAAAHEAHTEPPTQVGVLLFDGVQIIDFAAPYEVFGQAGFGVVTISRKGEAVTTAMGLEVSPDHSFEDAPPMDVLLVPGGNVENAAADRRTRAFLRDRAGAVRHILSVCTGATIVAAAGLLDGKRATTFHRALNGFEERFPKVQVIRDVRWVDNGKIITSAGLSSGVDASLHLVAVVQGEERARTVALHLEYDWSPSGGFVRTRLADRHLPQPDVDWPKGTSIRRTVSYGTADRWTLRFEVRSPASADSVQDLIIRAMDNEPGWQRSESTTWRKALDAGDVVLSLHRTNDAANKHEFEMIVEVLGPTSDSEAP
ncbi:MAG: DJ-1/PfpI family protein [Myxococcota bacterium]